MKRILSAFTAHPSTAGENYFEHLLFTLGMAWRMFVCGVVLVIHGIFPFLFEYGASNRMKKCQDILQERVNRQHCNKS